MSEPLTDHDVRLIVAAHVDEGHQGTHYEGCVATHTECAITALARTIDALRERLAAVEAVVEAARRVLEIMGSNPRDARFSEYAYEALFTTSDEIRAALAAYDGDTHGEA